MPAQKLSPEIISAAIEGFESQKRRIDAQIDELRQMLDGAGAEIASPSAAPRPKRKMSAAGRRRIAAAQKARWAKVRAQAAPASLAADAKPARKRRRLSAAGRKAISEATKKRWALKREGAQKRQTAGAKKTAAKKGAARRAGNRAPKPAEVAATATAQ